MAKKKAAPEGEATETAEASAPEAVVEKVKQPEQNGVVRPKPGTIVEQVWLAMEQTSDELGRPATRAEVRERLGDSINQATFATQYARCVKFHGVAEAVKSVRAQATEANRQRKVDERNAAKAEREAAKAKPAAAPESEAAGASA